MQCPIPSITRHGEPQRPMAPVVGRNARTLLMLCGLLLGACEPSAGHGAAGLEGADTDGEDGAPQGERPSFEGQLQGAPEGAADPPGPMLPGNPNVLLIILDDLGQDKVAAYEADFQTAAYTPSYSPTAMPSTRTIDELASAGLRFTNAWANPVCSPTRASTYTGTYPLSNGVGSPQTPDLDLALVSLADVLHGDPDGDGERENLLVGYEAGLFGKWHLGDGGHVSEGNAGSGTEVLHPIQHGWDYFVGELDGSVDSYWGWTRVEADATGWSSQVVTDYTTEVLVDDMLLWVDGVAGAWFATMAFQAPHSLMDAPYADTFEPPGSTDINRCWPGGTLASTEPGKLAQTVTCTDRYIERLLDGLETKGELDDTIIIFMGDNGTQGSFQEDIFSTDGRAKGSVYEDGVNVPFIVTQGKNWRELRAEQQLSDDMIVSPGREVEHPVHVVDIFATLAEVVGVGLGANVGADSVSFAPYLDDPSAAAQRGLLYSERYSGSTWNLAMRGTTHKVVVNISGGSSTCELYNLANDPRETNDLSGDPSTAMVRQIFTNQINALHAGTNDLVDLYFSGC